MTDKTCDTCALDGLCVYDAQDHTCERYLADTTNAAPMHKQLEACRQSLLQAERAAAEYKRQRDAAVKIGIDFCAENERGNLRESLSAHGVEVRP